MTTEEFIKKYCRLCGSQKCEGPWTEWFDGCEYANELSVFRGMRSKIRLIQDLSKEELERILYNALDESGIPYSTKSTGRIITPEDVLPIEAFRKFADGGDGNGT